MQHQSRKCNSWISSNQSKITQDLKDQLLTHVIHSSSHLYDPCYTEPFSPVRYLQWWTIARNRGSKSLCDPQWWLSSGSACQSDPPIPYRSSCSGQLFSAPTLELSPRTAAAGVYPSEEGRGRRERNLGRNMAGSCAEAAKKTKLSDSRGTVKWWWKENCVLLTF